MVHSSDVIDLLSQLIGFDTSNWGGGRAHGELECAEWIAGQLEDIGLEPQILAREDAPVRANLVVRVRGHDSTLAPLLVHGHLDVVPAEAEQWSHDPFTAVVSDGWVIGRGAMDMKDMCAAILSTLLQWGDEGIRPRRDLVVAFVADEEDMGLFGAEWLVADHPRLFSGCRAAVGEDGALWTPVTHADGSTVHLYPLACAERGAMHMRLTARGDSGHGSRPTKDDAAHRLIGAVHRIANHEWPLAMSTVVREQLVQTAEAVGLDVDTDDEDSVLNLIDALGKAAGPLRYTVRGSSTPTMLKAGYKVNVVPSLAQAEIDVRCPPGAELAMSATLDELIGPDVEYEYGVQQNALEAGVDTTWYRAMKRAIEAADPEAVVVPMCMGGGSDGKAFARLGMSCYGFSPVMRDPDGRRPTGIHGVDERNSVIGLRAGQRVLRHFLETV